MGSGIHNLCYGAVNLKAVPVKDRNEIVKLIMSGKHRCLPYLTLLALPVTENRVNTVILFIHLTGKSHTASRGEAESERACGHINTGSTLHIRVTLEIRGRFSESFKIFLGEISTLRKSCVKHGSRVTFREYEAVASLRLGVFGINVHLLKVEISHNVSHRERSAGVSAACVIYSLDNADTNIVSNLRELQFF